MDFDHAFDLEAILYIRLSTLPNRITVITLVIKKCRSIQRQAVLSTIILVGAFYKIDVVKKCD